MEALEPLGIGREEITQRGEPQALGVAIETAKAERTVMGQL